jgi:signal transduction histidine kinase
MRLLSQRVVATQEDERRNLSRELHDHVAQVLTALRMELGRIERTRVGADARVAAALAESRQLVDQMFRTVRDLALGLRPSMLDDLGLQPALEWHVRDVTHRYGVDVQLEVHGQLESLPDRLRTCIYRSVQEALTNCVRHAQARSITVAVNGHPRHIDVSVSDDGIGFDPGKPRSGLGLRGIEERVKELQGAMVITGVPGRGTTIRLRLPVPPVAGSEVPRARAAG